MRKTRIGLVFVLFLAAAARAQTGFGTTHVFTFPEGIGANAAILEDVDGDRRTDLVIATHDGQKKFARALRVYLRRADAPMFRPAPDFTVDLTPDVVAFAVADVTEDPGAEIVLFTANAVFACRPKAPEKDAFRKLFAARFLWQFPGPDNAIPWQNAVADLDGDGLPDFLIPEPAALRVVLQRPRTAGAVPEWSEPVTLTIPDEGDDGRPQGFGRNRVSGDDRRISVRFSFGSGGENDGPMLSIDERCPAPEITDVDGDGIPDIVAQGVKKLFVWKRAKGAAFASAPTESWTLPVVADFARRIDVSYRSLLEDIDGDGLVDGVTIAGDQRSEGVRTQILSFLQKKPGPGATLDPADPLYGKKGIPRQVLVVAGFAGDPDLVDVDGDGRPDLVVGSLRVDTLDALRAATSDAIDAEVYVYRSKNGEFSPAPDLTRRVSLKVEGIRKGRRDLTARFIGDVTGDGVSELLVRDRPEHLSLSMVKKMNDQLTVIDRPLFEKSIGEDAKVTVPRSGDKRSPEILIVEKAQVSLVRFR